MTTISRRVARDLHCAIARYSRKREEARFTLGDDNDESEEVRALTARIEHLRGRLAGHMLSGGDLNCRLHIYGRCPKPRY